ncbi:MAG TPA: SUF system Fe-S cluster assembly protein [Bacteroidales bacterium]|jgi:FeS assembly SUF system protein|nr:SUF system Fe-S cluster assembly protein [Bacteroidales bacterium]HQQ01705.1 SUF system Fe-S cluster assembly protein [Bacteroidales bacterium]
MSNPIEKSKLTEEIIKELKILYDPEIPINIYDLGLIYEIKIDDDNNVYILMSLTAPNCPVAESLPADVNNAVENIDGVKSCQVEVTFDPPWDQSMISDAALLELGLL